MYYTIILAYEPHGSPWHPTESTGPFAELSRGSFKTEEDAHTWALANIPGYTYRIRPLDSDSGEIATYADTGEVVTDIPGRAPPAGHGLNGAHVIRRGETIFIPLPRAMWRPIDGGCCCRYCSKDRTKTGPAFWDTLAVAADPAGMKGPDTTWTVHMPEAHRAR